MKKQVIKTQVSLSNLNIDSQIESAMTFFQYYAKVKKAYTKMIHEAFNSFEESKSEKLDGLSTAIEYIPFYNDIGDEDDDGEGVFGQLSVLYPFNGVPLISIFYPDMGDDLFEDLNHEKDLISVKSLENAIFNNGGFSQISGGKINDYDSFLKHMPSILKNDIESLNNVIIDLKDEILNHVEKKNMLDKFQNENKSFSLEDSKTLDLLKKFEIETEKNKKYSFYQIKGQYYLLTTTYVDFNVLYSMSNKHLENSRIDIQWDNGDYSLIKDIEISKLEIIHH